MTALALTAFNSAHKDVGEGLNFASDTLKVMFTNTLPVATNAVKSDITEIAAGNGYPAGGISLTGLTGAFASGVYTRMAANISLTAAGGNIGPFQWVVFYDDTVGSPVKPLLCWGDLGSAITLLNGGAPLNIDLTTTGFVKN